MTLIYIILFIFIVSFFFVVDNFEWFKIWTISLIFCLGLMLSLGVLNVVNNSDRYKKVIENKIEQAQQKEIEKLNYFADRIAKKVNITNNNHFNNVNIKGK